MNSYFALKDEEKTKERTREDIEIVLRPKDNVGLCRKEISDSCISFSIPRVKHQRAFFGNSKDSSPSLSSIPNFPSSFSDSLSEFRKTILTSFGITSHEEALQILAPESSVVVEPVVRAPSRNEISRYVRAKELLAERPLSPKNSLAEKAISSEDEDEKELFEASVIKIRHNSNESENSCSTSSSSSSSLSSSSSDDELLESSQLDETLRVKLQDSEYRRQFDSLLVDSSITSQIEGSSLVATHKLNLEKLKEANVIRTCQYITLFSLELHINNRQKLLPDPEFDSISAVFYTVDHDLPDESHKRHVGVIVVVEAEAFKKDFLSKAGINEKFFSRIDIVTSEKELFVKLLETIIPEHDPDILVGFETNKNSWGYLAKRAGIHELHFPSKVSRCPMDKVSSYFYTAQNEEFTSSGRIVFNLWKLLRSELRDYTYSFENMMFHILHTRLSVFEPFQLSEWWKSPRSRWKVFTYFTTRSNGNLDLIFQLDLINRTTEWAKLSGILFQEVLFRGSQNKVESLMLRFARNSNFVPFSPRSIQREAMRATEYIPLVLEPESKFYTDPVLVLDFASLYPSIMIAYNYCYSTCLGRLSAYDPTSSSYELGCSRFPQIPSHVFFDIKDRVNFSPAGVFFVSSEILPGILPKMLSDILKARAMIKKSMKLYKNDASLSRILHARQLGLKMIANVTYGYTAANVSGRMPCTEIADSVVSKGRETLERCISLIERNRDKWGGRVVYGDTDSVFVLCEGKSKEEAFNIGEEIAEAVTKDNPKPIQLKFEKVYYPCILQSKKRYVGYSYESKEQTSPIYDAKGIETVRRDGVPAVMKILEKSLRILFDTKNVSLVKTYVQRQFQKILSERSSIQDLTFTKQFRGLHGYKPGASVPSLELIRRLMKKDRRIVPKAGDRVSYVIVYGEPGKKLISSVRSPSEVIINNLRLNGVYYITKVIIPPLNRCFILFGVDVLHWFSELPRNYRPRFHLSSSSSHQQKGVILQYFSGSACVGCDFEHKNSQSSLCQHCLREPQRTVWTLTKKMCNWERILRNLSLECRKCTGMSDFIDECINYDCPLFYRRNVAFLDAFQNEYIQNVLQSHF